MRRVWLFLGGLGGFGMVLVVVLAFASGSGAARPGGGGSREKMSAGVRSRPGVGLRETSVMELARARRTAAARRRRLESPTSQESRVRSRTAFRGLGVGAARRLLAGDYGSQLAGVSGNPAVAVERSGRVVRYLNNYRALVRGRHGLEVLTSSAPLRVSARGGGLRPVDLRLEAGGGGFAPVRPLVDVSVAEASAGGVAVGGDGLRVSLEGENVVGGLMAGQDVFFGGVGRDMDAVISPTLGGAELFAVLRSRESPEVIRYRLALPAGAVLVAQGGGAVVERGGVPLARIPTPVARDAQGSEVGVSMVVAGDELVLTVAHRGHDVAYPLLVDPSVISVTENAKGWEFKKSHRFCEEAQIFGKAPGGGSRATVEAPLTSYPRPMTELCGEEERNYQIAEGREAWVGSVYFTAVEFYNVALAFTLKPEEEEAVFWKLGGCGTGEMGYNSKPPPSIVLLETPNCHPTSENGASLTLLVGQIKSLEPLTLSAALSVEAILLHEAWVLPEESEGYGGSNPGEPYRPKCMLGHPVDCATGNQVESQTDLHVGGRGLGLDLTRTYNSRLAAKLTSHGVFGYGWTGPYNAHLTTEKVVSGLGTKEVATVYQDNGSTVRFERGSSGEPWTPTGPLVQAALVPGGGSNTVYTLPDQSKLTFDGNGRVSSEADRNGNTTTMSRNGEGRLDSVTDPAGRKLTFAYNGEGLVESVKDPLGHTTKYTYEAGNLATVTEPGKAVRAGGSNTTPRTS